MGDFDMRGNEFEPLERIAWLVEKLKLSQSTVYRKLASKEIPAVIVSRGCKKKSYRIRPSEIESWLKTRQC
jgi:excisionase family DNA binding protein